jgi:hypothetical protein
MVQFDNTLVVAARGLTIGAELVEEGGPGYGK